MSSKLRDFKVGETIEIPLVVKAAEMKTTRGKTPKPYLTATFTDGTDDIKANYWDWPFKNAPEKNAILMVSASITEYMGTKQLTVTKLDKNVVMDLSYFAPQGEVNVNQYMTAVWNKINGLNNTVLRELATEILGDYSDLWEVVPGAKSVHHAYVGGTIKHCSDVADIAEMLGARYDGCNTELCYVGGLFHDLGKLWTYKLEGVVIDMTEEGELLDHIAIGIARMETYRTPENSSVVDLLQHIIASHHGKLEYGSPVTPRFLEAFMVNFADGVDSKANTLLELNKGLGPCVTHTKKEWTLDNREMFTQNYVFKKLYGYEKIDGGEEI